ncbi:hypothetical protein [Glaciecola sp. SC05]|uniref:GH39 family glycosyl hydrolase n=1 Tax=Glaciecola sp. SC05 TaxID=1987355 RepID=UPI0035284814
MKVALLRLFFLFGIVVLFACAQPIRVLEKDVTSQTNHVTLSVDFSKSANATGEVFDFFDVSVRTQNASVNSIPAKFDRRAKVNTVRMLGGFFNKDLQADTYKWDGENYVYDFKQATNRIDAWLGNDWDIFQIVLDNPPWAFQRGMVFVDEANGKDYLSKDARGVYGNVLPPNDPVAWRMYISAFIQHLVNTYGEEMVRSWRFRVGSEIDTRPQHWAATRQEFFDHYKNTVEAVHAVLPEAKVGTQFREASFKGRYVDYTGNTEDAYAPHFVEWAKANDVHYDFIAISYYPHIHKPQELDMALVYAHDMAPVQRHPDWSPEASFEIHEFKLISKMQRGGFVSVATSHSSSFFAMMAKMVLENGIAEVFQWGNVRKGEYIAEAMTQLALHSMVGNHLFVNQRTGEPKIANNRVDGIFTQKPDKQGFDMLLFNFNATDLSYQAPESIRLVLNVDFAEGTAFNYRLANIDASNNHNDLFYADFSEQLISQSKGGWLVDDIHATSSPNKRLSNAGQIAFTQAKQSYIKNNRLLWSDWQSLKVSTNGSGQSQIVIESTLASFGVQRIEVLLADTVVEIF